MLGGVDLALMKYCNRNGCNQIVRQGVAYCKKHTQTNAERHREYDKNCRNKVAKMFYNSGEWKLTRAIALSRDMGIDVYIYITKGEVIQAKEVHHIIELSEDYSKRCELGNLISLSDATHSVISKAYKDPHKKEKMQHVLRECMKEFKKRLA